MQPDSIEYLNHSIVQHGPFNDRVYLMKLDKGDLPDVVNQVYDLGRHHGYSKLFAKVPASAATHFTDCGFVEEAFVPNMYRGEAPGLFMSKYLDQSRAIPKNIERISKVLQCADQCSGDRPREVEHSDLDRLRTGDVDALAELYGDVFETYPFPMDDPSYIRQCMLSDTLFFGIFSGTRLVAAASAELDMDWQCAEMTDFATLPEYRGQGAATRLLTYMEEILPEMGIKTCYTIARAESYGMNVVFSRCGYTFSGTLHNNTQIGGKLESMNVWHKQVISR